MIMSEAERDSCQLTELSAVERANVVNDDKAALFFFLIRANIYNTMPDLPMRFVTALTDDRQKPYHLGGSNFFLTYI